MHIQVINYQRTFNLGNYASEKIGVEVAINAGENAKEALETAKSLVEEYHKENVAKLKDLGYFYEDQIQVETIPTQSKETRDEKTKKYIDFCKTKEELKAWELMSKSSPELLEYYNKKFKSIK
jgi:hypothetical protein